MGCPLGVRPPVRAAVIALYFAFLYFQLHPPKRAAAARSGASAPAAASDDGDDGGENDSDGDDDGDELLLTLPAAVGGLALVSALTAVVSDALVDTIEGAAPAWGVPLAFVATVVLPVVGNASEHASAVLFALKDRPGLSCGIALGSSAQISAFLVPLCVLAGAVFSQPLSLDIGPFEAVSFLTAALLVAVVVADGRSTALRGMVLVAAYLAFAAGCWAHLDPRLEAEKEDTGGAAGIVSPAAPPPLAPPPKRA